MKKIGIISDTHAYFNDKIINFFSDIDIIFHAGDIGSTDVIKKFRNIAELHAVYGNIDNRMIKEITKEFVVINVENVKILMTHIGGYPGRYESVFYKKILEEKPNIVITGHSHILKVLYDKKLNHLHINPGAFGNSGFHKVNTAIRLVIDGENIKDLEVLEVKRN